MKKGMDRYATEKRYIQKGYLRKYRNGNPSWKTPEASSSDSVQQSREVKEIEIKEQLNDNDPNKGREGCYVGEPVSSQLESCEARIMAMQPIPGSSNKRTRKAKNLKKRND